MERRSLSDAEATGFGFGIDENRLLEPANWRRYSDPEVHLRERDWLYYEEDDSESTRVPHSQPATGATYISVPPTQISPSQPATGQTFDSVLKRYEEAKERFLESETWVRLQRIVQKHVSHPIQIDNAVCIALGSLSSVGQRSGTLDDRTCSLIQLAAFIAVVGELQTKMSKLHGKMAHVEEQGVVEPQYTSQVKISMTAQEPQFNDLDKQVLQHLGIRVVPDPEIWYTINKRSMVYMPGAEGTHFLEVSRRKPAMWWPVESEYFEDLEE